MSLPLSIILKELESSPTSIIPILSTLYYDKSILSTISNADLKHLVSRALNLSRSPNQFNKWCGINLIKVLSNNYNIISNEGINMVNQLVKILENYNETIDLKIFNSAVESLNFLCKKIRGKPTLTREILTPKLSTIIGIYLAKIHHNSDLIIQSLNDLMKNHPTTFRPFGNKLGNKLFGLIESKDFESFPVTLRNTIYETLATLPVIEKNDPDAKWEENVHNLIKELSSVLFVYNEFLNLNDDNSLLSLFKKLPKYEETESERLLPNLSIDINEPTSIFQVSTRIEILLNLLKYFLISETQFSVKVPIGLVLIVNEIICSINTKFISFRNDIRDDLIKKTIESSTLINQLNSIKFLNEIAFTYKGNLVPHLKNVLSFLEILISFKNKKIDYNILLSNETFNCELIECVGNYLSLVSNLNDSSQLLRFIDVALCLAEPRINDSQQQPKSDTTSVSNGSNKKNKKKKKNASSVPLSDLLSHQHLFTDSVPISTIKSVRKFLNAIITRVDLPPTQRYKIMRYLIIETVHAKYSNYDKSVPSELRSLLINSVLFPDFEKVSLLPIVSSLLRDDPLLSVFNNPRFPPLPIYIKKAEAIEDVVNESDEEEDEGVNSEGEESSNIKRRKINIEMTGDLSLASNTSSHDQPMVDVELKEKRYDSEKLFTNLNINPEQIIKFAPGVVNQDELIAVQKEEIAQERATTPSIVENEISATSAASIETRDATATQEKADESDFEMPSIDIDDSDDE